MLDSGKAEVEIIAHNQAKFKLTNFDEKMPEIFVRSLKGWTKGILMQSGVKNVLIDIEKTPDEKQNDIIFAARWIK